MSLEVETIVYQSFFSGNIKDSRQRKQKGFLLETSTSIKKLLTKILMKRLNQVLEDKPEFQHSAKSKHKTEYILKNIGKKPIEEKVNINLVSYLHQRSQTPDETFLIELSNLHSTCLVEAQYRKKVAMYFVFFWQWSEKFETLRKKILASLSKLHFTCPKDQIGILKLKKMLVFTPICQMSEGKKSTNWRKDFSFNTYHAGKY